MQVTHIARAQAGSVLITKLHKAGFPSQQISNKMHHYIIQREEENMEAYKAVIRYSTLEIHLYIYVCVGSFLQRSFRYMEVMLLLVTCMCVYRHT